MKAIILAAGEGTRLKKYTQDLPKGMLPFADKTLIEHQIDAYRSAGIEDVIIVRGFQKDRITYPNVTYYDNDDWQATNMVASLFAARSEFDDDIIVSYSDIIFEPRVLEGLCANKDDVCVTVDVDWKTYWMMRYGSTGFDTESLVLAPDGSIQSLGEEAPDPSKIDARYVGLLKFSKRGCETISSIWDEARDTYWDQPWQVSGKPLRKAYLTDLLQAVIESGAKVQPYSINNGWLEFDTNEDYENAIKWLQEGRIQRVFCL